MCRLVLLMVMIAWLACCSGPEGIRPAPITKAAPPDADAPDRCDQAGTGDRHALS